MKFLPVASIVAVVVSSAAARADNGQAVCERLRSLRSGASHVLAAEYIPAGKFELPAMGSFHPAPMMLPAHCSVRVFTATSPDSAVTSEIWLPDPAEWNGKLLGTGNGGYSSALSYRQMGEGLQRGFAVAGSDTGHQGDGLSFSARSIPSEFATGRIAARTCSPKMRRR